MGRWTLLTLGNDANVVYEYDLANRLTALTNNFDDVNSLVFAYDSYDKVGNRLSMKIDDANEQVYDYDVVYRLTYVDYNDGNDMSFVYDALGNRHRTIDGGTITYQTNSLNQYTSVAGTAYTYDDNGNLAFDGQFRYYYDCENRLTDVNDVNDAPVASYAYDYLGRRASRTIYGPPDVTIRYAYDGDRIVAEYDGSGTLLRKFVYGPGIDEPICLIDAADANALYYYHFDGLGSVVALCDVNSVPVERYTYDVFGRPTIRDANGVTIDESAFGNPYLFTGRAYDAETALYYYRARYYDYFTGRFLQPDPIGYGDGLNLYSYCRSNSVSRTDPLGLRFEVTGDEAVFYEAAADLMRSPTFEATFNYLNSSSTAIVVDVQTVDSTLSTGAVSGRTRGLSWNPYMAALLLDGGSQAPSMALAHELEHIKNKLEGDYDGNADPQFGIVDDRNVIMGPETRIADQTGEDTRTSHTIGGRYRVAGPNTKLPADMNEYLKVFSELVNKLLAWEKTGKGCPNR